MCEIELTIQHPSGFHARPAAKFVKLASNFPCDIKISNSTKNSPYINAKSILGVLSLGVEKGHNIHILVDGDMEFEAIKSLRLLVESNFGE